MSEPSPRRTRPLRVGVIGSARASEPLERLARDVGGEIARAGAILVCGGLGGIMAAAAAGAAAEGGTVVGLLPGTDAGAAAPGVSLPVPTGLGEARNVLVVRAAEALIAVGGEWGTLSEAAFARKFGVPLIGLEATLPPGVLDEAASGPGEAVARALALARSRRGSET